MIKNVISRCFYVKAQNQQRIKKYSLAVEYKLCVYLHHKSMAADFRNTSPALLKRNMDQPFFIHVLLELQRLGAGKQRVYTVYRLLALDFH